MCMFNIFVLDKYCNSESAPTYLNMEISFVYSIKYISPNKLN